MLCRAGKSADQRVRGTDGTGPTHVAGPTTEYREHFVSNGRGPGLARSHAGDVRWASGNHSLPAPGRRATCVEVAARSPATDPRQREITSSDRSWGWAPPPPEPVARRDRALARPARVALRRPPRMLHAVPAPGENGCRNAHLTSPACNRASPGRLPLLTKCSRYSVVGPATWVGSVPSVPQTRWSADFPARDNTTHHGL